MIKRKHIAGVLTLGAVLTSSALAQADPVRPTPQEVSASGGQMCAIINQNASQDGVIAAVESLAPYGYTDLTGAYITFHSIIYVCPQHEQLVFETFNQLLPDECDLRT